MRAPEPKIACIMCTWEESQMVPLAIESSKDFAFHRIVDRETVAEYFDLDEN